MEFFWVGFYIVRTDELVLGPFQGSIACTRIQKGKGVCGTVWETGGSLIVPNVDEFPGHIACSSDSKSEIVLPVLKNGEVALILDVDSDQLDDFNEVDLIWLKKLMNTLEQML
jgi:GAF domain-containing protein